MPYSITRAVKTKQYSHSLSWELLCCVETPKYLDLTKTEDLFAFNTCIAVDWCNHNFGRELGSVGGREGRKRGEGRGGAKSI